MNEVEGLKNVREVIESEMKNCDSDALTAKLISALQTSRGLDEHAIIQDELDSLVAPFRKQVRENIQEQEKLLGFIEKANAEFTREKVQNETSKMRDEMLKNLATASDGFNELYNHLVEGIKVEIHAIYYFRTFEYLSKLAYLWRRIIDVKVEENYFFLTLT